MGLWDLGMRAISRHLLRDDFAPRVVAEIALPMPAQIEQPKCQAQSPNPPERGPGPAQALARMRARPHRLTAEEARAAFEADRGSLKRRVVPLKAAEIFVSFMQEYDATGYFSVGEIDAWWHGCMDALGLDYLHPAVLRSELAAIPGCYIGNKRLNRPAFRSVKARTGRERAVLYRIPMTEIEARAGAGHEAGHVPDDAGARTGSTTGARSGKRPVNPQKRVLTGPDAWSCTVYQGSHGDFVPPIRRIA